MMPKKILIIDDESILTKTFKRLLEKKGYVAKTAENHREAKELFQTEDFDLILSDMRMPEKNGVETARDLYAIREQQGKPPVSIIFLTGFADKKLEEEAQKLEPLAYIYKPFDAFKLLEIIETHLNRKVGESS